MRRLFGAATRHFSDRREGVYSQNTELGERVKYPARECRQVVRTQTTAAVEKAKHTQEGKGRNGIAHVGAKKHLGLNVFAEHRHAIEISNYCPFSPEINGIDATSDVGTITRHSPTPSWCLEYLG